MSEYTQGICADGAAILKDGVMMTIEEILEGLRQSVPQSVEPVGYYDPKQSKEELAFSFTHDGDGFVPVYVTPPLTVPKGYVLVLDTTESLSTNRLSDKMRFWRAERPDEWTMDEFIRDAQILEAMLHNE
jgi:hypothetical protein